jgi:hypothetical protein
MGEFGAGGASPDRVEDRLVRLEAGTQNDVTITI